MPKIWCAQLTQDMEDIWPPQLYSEEECPPKKLMSKCWTSKTKIVLTSLNGFPTISNHQFVISLQKVWRWPLPSSVTPLLSKKCSKELLNNSLLCLEEKLSSTGTLVKVWTKWSSLKLNQTWTTWSQNINNIKMPQPKKKTKLMKKKLKPEIFYA